MAQEFSDDVNAERTELPGRGDRFMWQRVCPLSDLPDGSSIRCDVGRGIAIFHVDGELFAVDDTCTHGESSLSEGWVENCQVECNFHFGRFDLRTGEAVAFPAEIDLNTHKVKVDEGYVVLWTGEPTAVTNEIENPAGDAYARRDAGTR